MFLGTSAHIQIYHVQSSILFRKKDECCVWFAGTHGQLHVSEILPLLDGPCPRLIVPRWSPPLTTAGFN